MDVSAEMDGFHGDTAYTFACGKISKEAEQLLKVTNEKSSIRASNRRCRATG